MYRAQTLRSCVLLAALAVVGGAESAKYEGRLIGRVVDPVGEPVEGVVVTATSAEVTGFQVVETTDRKGTFIVDFEKVGVTYRYKLEKAGYQTLETDQRWDLVGKARHDFVIHPATAASAEELLPTASSDPVVVAYSAGVVAFRARDLVTAQARFEEAVKLEPELHQAWAALAVVHLEQKQYQNAVAAAEQAMALGATDETVLRTRWEALRQLGDEDKAAAALADLQRYAEVTEEARRIYNEGVAFVKDGDHENAFLRFQEALKVDPNLEEALNGLAAEGLKTQRYQESLDAAEALLKNDPEDGQALRVRYNAALGIGDGELIAETLVGLAAVEPGVARDGLLHLAYEAYDANDLARAKALFEKVIAVDPKQPQSHYLLALIHVNDGAKGEARQHLLRYLELAPDEPEAETARELLAFLGRP